MLPSIDGCVSQCIIVLVYSVGPVVVAEVLPQTFDGIQLWRIRWQPDDRDILWYTDAPGGVEPCLVPDKHRVNLR